MSLLKGYNTTVLAYGQTGSGKTHTMANTISYESDDNNGVILRVLHDLFRRINDNENNDIKYTVRVSFIEVI